MSFNVLVVAKVNPFQELESYYQMLFANSYNKAITYLKKYKIKTILLEVEMFDSRFKALVESNNVLLFSSTNPLVCLKLLEHDNLTGLSNKNHFYSHVDLLFSKAQAENFSLSIIMIDIDNFKQINDKLGHLAGDEVLKKLIQKIKANIREDDFLARFGGDEFIIALPNTTIIQAKTVAQRLLSKLEISLGIAAFRAEDENLKILVNRADQALYKAKASGKNRIEISE